MIDILVSNATSFFISFFKFMVLSVSAQTYSYSLCQFEPRELWLVW